MIVSKPYGREAAPAEFGDDPTAWGRASSNMRGDSNRLISSGRHWLMAASIAGHWCASGIHRRTLDSTESRWQKSHWIPSDFAGFRQFSFNVSASIVTSLAARPYATES
jgi:hypothetical protein